MKYQYYLVTWLWGDRTQVNKIDAKNREQARRCGDVARRLLPNRNSNQDICIMERNLQDNLWSGFVWAGMSSDDWQRPYSESSVGSTSPEEGEYSWKTAEGNFKSWISVKTGGNP